MFIADNPKLVEIPAITMAQSSSLGTRTNIQPKEIMSTAPIVSEASVPTTLAELKELVTTRLEKTCNDLPSWNWLYYETLDVDQFSDQDLARAKRLFFGDMQDVLRRYEDDNFDALFTTREEVVKRELVSLIDGDLADVIEAFADEHGLDGMDLAEELKSDNEFSPENLDVPSVDTEYTYRGKVAVIAETKITLTFTPGDDLLNALRLLRVPAQQYLQACKTMIAQHGFSFDEPGPFTDDVLQGQDEDTSMGIYEAYARAFAGAVRSSADAGLYGELSASGEPVVDVAEMVDAMRQWDESVDLFVHTTCSGTTLNHVSSEISSREFDPETTHLVAEDGLLAAEKSPDEISVDIRLIGPIALPADAFEVVKGRPIKIHQEVRLSEDLWIGCFLASEMAKLRDRPSMFSGESTLTALLKLADRIPSFRANDLAQELPGLGIPAATAPVVARLVERAEAPLSDHERQHGLLSCLAPDSDATPGRRDHALWLIDNGADVNAALENGVTPLMLAARLQESSIVAALLSAGAEPNRLARDPLSGSMDTALSIAARPLLRYQSVQAASACVGILLDGDSCLPNAPVRGDRLDHAERQSKPILFSTATGRADLVRRTIEQESMNGRSILQRDLDTALYEAGCAKDLEIGCLLVESGANPDGVVANRLGEESTVLEGLREVEQHNRGNTEGADQFNAMLRAHLARQAISRVACGGRAKTSSPAIR
jgi:ankyrin repeat protein